MSPLVANAQYWLIAASNGSSVNYTGLVKSNQTSGVSTSTTGASSTWASVAEGLIFEVWPNVTGNTSGSAAVGNLGGVWEDGGVRWTTLGYSGSQITNVLEYTAGTVAGDELTSSRALTVVGSQLSSVT
jgi:hypothetical protein